MNIEDKTFVAIDYRLSLDSGEEIDRSPDGKPLGFVTGTGRILPGLEKELMGMVAGNSARVTLEAKDAYGEVNKNLLRDVPANEFPKDVEIKEGKAFRAQSARGPVTITIARVNDDETVTIDLNHPMAGKRLHFELKVVEVREPLAGEIVEETAGCACGPEGGDGCGSGAGSGCACG
jgi:FKBP-type peptidyl-prolyl cis-trans isomerase SlyD